LSWALTVLLVASYNRNPLYGVLLLLVTLWVHAAYAEVEEGGTVSLAPLRFALFAVPLAATFNALSSHVGTTVLLELPSWLPLIGGAVTVEAIAFGAVNGLNLTVIFVGFTAFNHALTVRQLISLTPRAFHESGVVLSVALTFVPQTMRSLGRIREAQAVRGHRLRGLRDWLPILTPLLVGALERALSLAESMAARGYATDTAAARPRTRLLLALGLLVLLGGWLAYLFVPALRGLGVAALLLGLLLIITALWLAGRATRATLYRPRRWRVADTLGVVGCLPVLVVLLTTRAGVYYTPYPTLTWPPFDPLIGVSLLGLLAPAFFSGR
jgi:energy-coupling factor transport system permease protein